MAITGKAWVTTITGRRRWRVGGRKLMRSARAAPASGAEGETDERLGEGGDGVLAPELGTRLEGGEDARRRRQDVGGRRENRHDGLPDQDEADRDEEGANRDHRRPPDRVGWAKRSVPTAALNGGHAALCPPYTSLVRDDRSMFPGSLQAVRMCDGVMAEIEFPSLRRHDPDQVRRVRRSGHLSSPLQANTPRNGRKSIDPGRNRKRNRRFRRALPMADAADTRAPARRTNSSGAPRQCR